VREDELGFTGESHIGTLTAYTKEILDSKL